MYIGAKQLVEWVREAAEESGIFDGIFVDTMDIRAECLKPYDTTTDDIIKWYMENHKADCYCFLQTCNPFTTAAHIKDCYELFQIYNKNVVSVNMYTMQPNGNIYMCKDTLPYESECVPYRMTPEDSIHIDYKYQLQIARGIYYERLNIRRNWIHWTSSSADAPYRGYTYYNGTL